MSNDKAKDETKKCKVCGDAMWTSLGGTMLHCNTCGSEVPADPTATEPKLSHDEEQRRSFAFGNCNIENPNVTRKAIDEAAERLASAPTPPPSERIAEIEARANAATKPPWTLKEDFDWVVVIGDCDEVEFEEAADAEFCAHARTDIPYLLAALKSAWARERWIPVTERLPAADEQVLEYDQKYGINQCARNSPHWRDAKPTHWMTLPEPPAAAALASSRAKGAT